jgi:hypothetical protein
VNAEFALRREAKVLITSYAFHLHPSKSAQGISFMLITKVHKVIRTIADYVCGWFPLKPVEWSQDFNLHIVVSFCIRGACRARWFA